MSSAPRARRDLLERFRRTEDLARLQRVRRRGHTETKTFIVGGEVDTNIYIPPFFIGIDSDGGTPEFKIVWGFRGVTASGSVRVQWLINGTITLGEQTISEDHLDSEVILTGDPLYVRDGDYVRPVIIDGSCQEFAGAVVFTTAPR